MNSNVGGQILEFVLSIHYILLPMQPNTQVVPSSVPELETMTEHHPQVRTSEEFLVQLVQQRLH